MIIDFIFIQIFLFITAVIGNTLSAFSGGGAGLIQLPALILLGLPFAKALATHKLASVALGIGASLRYIRSKTLDQKLVALILLCGLPGVFLGARFVLLIPEKFATYCLGFLTLLIGIYSSKKLALGQVGNEVGINKFSQFIGGLILFMIGFLNGSLTSGTGLFVTMWLVLWFGMSYTNAIAYTLILVGIIWNGTGAVLIGIETEIQWSWLPVLIGGSLIGGYLGAHLSIVKGDKLVKKAFEILAIVMGISLFAKGFSM